MTKDKKNPYLPLLKGVSQYEVDFVIPRIGMDIPIGIDPFLLYKSRDPFFCKIHEILLKAFNYGIQHVRKNKLNDARHLFKFPEVSEIGFGYSKAGKEGSGVGKYLTELIIETLADSPALAERGIKHIEEMQLVSVNIGPDRISDIAANLLKKFLIDYTQKQCEIWNIPLVSGVPVEHIFDPNNLTWYDSYCDLPISPFNKTPILLVPRRIVRAFPWINYEDYYRMEFSAFLRAKKVHARLDMQIKKKPAQKQSKKQVVSITRNEIERIDRYVSNKEKAVSEAQPAISYIELEDVKKVSKKLKARLVQLSPGIEDATKYHLFVLEALNFLFNPELIDGEMEVKTVDGTERRDIILTNDSDCTFWSYLRSEHSGLFLMFEVKNTKQVESSHFNQTAMYLGDRLGRIGFIVTRNPLSSAQTRKAFSIYNDSNPRKIILVMSDSDILNMIDMRCRGNDPMRYIQKMYRDFRTKVQ